MATITEETKEKLSFGDALADFIQRNRKALLITMISAVVIVIGFIAGFTIRDMVQEKAISAVEDFSRRYDILVIDINEPTKAEEVRLLLDELNAFGEKHSGYAGARAYSLAASIYTEKKDWAEAEEAWTHTAKSAGKSYLAPAALFNAAVAAEEQGNLTQAISLYSESAAHVSDFPGSARAQFSIGRLNESQGDTQAALEAYRLIPEKWTNETTWVNLAQDRIIVLSNSGS
ncbi:tetratricopeptide repeat protein [Treponema primitia]|uniref:tetratricopeptide repeat protein n=1 Tax=Treponema primitia TaxID=88058 RepID=UPI0002554E20|nr:tetratricopeptide repeat protein [Treponema primitia]